MSYNQLKSLWDKGLCQNIVNCKSRKAKPNKANLPIEQKIARPFGLDNGAFLMVLIVFGADSRYNSHREWICNNLTG